MKIFQAEALILEVSDLAEADRIVAFLTREEGKRRGVARGAKRRFSRFAGELQPLAKARIGWVEKEGRDLVRINAVELIRPVKLLQQDLEGILLGATIAEQVALFAQEGEPARRSSTGCSMPPSRRSRRAATAISWRATSRAG